MAEDRVFLAHFNEATGEKQTIQQHSENTAELSAQNAVAYMSRTAYLTGLAHDIGKFRDGFQARINGGAVKCEHACCGAQEIRRIARNDSRAAVAQMMMYCISGHHTGLQNGMATDGHPQSSLKDALDTDTSDVVQYRQLFEPLVQLPEAEDVKELNSALMSSTDKQEFTERFAFFTRYLFSCLTDADFIDTEHFYDKTVRRGLSGDVAAALERVKQRLADFPADSEVRKARQSLLCQVLSDTDGAPVSILNMPTGSGKTFCSIRYSLERAVKSGKKRIIYVLPFTSIIEQTADVFEGCFGEVLPVLQHHSNFDTEGSELDADILRRTTENWDAPLIITTNVQFFQSLYHNRSSRLRKLHNLADSIIIFDEVHMMPVEYLQPCLRAVGYITKYLNSEAVFMSATMPDFSTYLKKYSDTEDIKQLVTDTSEFGKFRNCDHSYIGECSDEVLLSRSSEFSSSLIVVNNRKVARRLYEQCTARNKFYLSTYMTPVHRSAVIAEIRELLKNGEELSVFSTSLIEAGVDLDFEAVFRELAGLDSILQTAGRCNREGLRENGYMHIFSLEGSGNKSLAMQANICRSLIEEYEDITAPECISEYYRRLYAASYEVIAHNTIYRDGMNPNSIPFRDYAESFNFINSDTVNVVIPTDEIAELVASLKYTSSIPRKLSRYCASLHSYEARKLREEGVLSDVNGVLVLDFADYYNEKTGLDPDYQPNTVI